MVRLGVVYRRKREEEEEEEEVTTESVETQTDGDATVGGGTETESLEMVELRRHEAIDEVETIVLPPTAPHVPAASPARRPGPRHSTRAFAATAGSPPPPPPAPAPKPSTSTLAVTAQPELRRLTTEEIAERLHSHGTGSKNVQPG